MSIEEKIQDLKKRGFQVNFMNNFMTTNILTKKKGK